MELYMRGCTGVPDETVHRDSVMIPIFKNKGDGHSYSNYRVIK